MIDSKRGGKKEGNARLLISNFAVIPPPPFSLRLTERFPRASAQTAEPLCVATVEQNGLSQGEKNPTGKEEGRKINARKGF